MFKLDLAGQILHLRNIHACTCFLILVLWVYSKICSCYCLRAQYMFRSCTNCWIHEHFVVLRIKVMNFDVWIKGNGWESNEKIKSEIYLLKCSTHIHVHASTFMPYFLYESCMILKKNWSYCILRILILKFDVYILDFHGEERKISWSENIVLKLQNNKGLVFW